MVLDPYPERLRGKISRLGDQLEAPPEQIKRHYAAGQKLLPVYVRPAPETHAGWPFAGTASSNCRSVAFRSAERTFFRAKDDASETIACQTQ